MKKIFKCVFGVFLGLFVISFFVNCYLFGMQPEQVVAGMNVSDLGPLIKDIAGIAGDKGGQVALICKLEEFGAVVKFLLEEDTKPEVFEKLFNDIKENQSLTQKPERQILILKELASNVEVFVKENWNDLDDQIKKKSMTFIWKIALFRIEYLLVRVKKSIDKIEKAKMLNYLFDILSDVHDDKYLEPEIKNKKVAKLKEVQKLGGKEIKDKIKDGNLMALSTHVNSVEEVIKLEEFGYKIRKFLWQEDTKIEDFKQQFDFIEKLEMLPHECRVLLLKEMVAPITQFLTEERKEGYELDNDIQKACVTYLWKIGLFRARYILEQAKTSFFKGQKKRILGFLLAFVSDESDDAFLTLEMMADKAKVQKQIEDEFKRPEVEEEDLTPKGTELRKALMVLRDKLLLLARKLVGVKKAL
ncbi:MAG: hypothetical protein ABH827_04645 [bacterium]